jgi:hypothetical protein
MAHVTGDRVKDTTTTTGTGNITVSGTAPTGFRTLSAVATADGDTLFLAIVGGAEWETSLATRVSANVYTRTTILASSNSGSAVSFAAGTKDVFLTLPATRVADDTAYASTWNGDTIRPPSKNAVFDKIESFVTPQIKSGNWFQLTAPATGNAGTAIGANTIYYSMFQVYRAVTISDLGARVATVQAAQNFKLAIYAHSTATGLPTGVPIAETGNMSTATSAVVTADIAVVADVTLQPGHYWAAIWCDHGTPTFTSNSGANTTVMAINAGSATADNLINANANISIMVSSAETYGTWPDAGSETYTERMGTARNVVMIAKAV